MKFLMTIMTAASLFCALPSFANANCTYVFQDNFADEYFSGILPKLEEIMARRGWSRVDVSDQILRAEILDEEKRVGNGVDSLAYLTLTDPHYRDLFSSKPVDFRGFEIFQKHKQKAKVKRTHLRAILKTARHFPRCPI